MHEKYFLEIVSVIQKKTLIGADIMFVWAAARQPELYTQERALDEELNALWPGKSEINKDFEAFKTKVLSWGRVVLQLYKKFKETKT